MKRTGATPERSRKPGKSRASAGEPRLLSGGNPQIAKAEGDTPVQAYIAAMPGWKRDLGRRLDALVVRTVPAVVKAVKWNSPFYGVEGQGWFLSFHVFTRYVKVTFFRGTALRPVPPGGTHEDARWIDVHEDDLDEQQMADWIRQAAAIPGWETGKATAKPKSGAAKRSSSAGGSASEKIDARIAELGDWRGRTLARMRKLVKEADPDVVETWKWRGVPVWEHDGILCTGESYKSVVKLTFAKGASLDDPAGLFNASLEGSTRRAIDVREGEEVDAGAFKALVRAAVAHNAAGRKARPARGRSGTKR